MLLSILTTKIKWIVPNAKEGAGHLFMQEQKPHETQLSLSHINLDNVFCDQGKLQRETKVYLVAGNVMELQSMM